MTATKLVCAVFTASLLLSGTTPFRQPVKQWYEQLPSCPCRNPDWKEVVLGDGWAKDKGDLRKFHRGATASFRSYPAIKTAEGNSCQQCCYDAHGDLITSGRGAGTPDKSSACAGEDKNGIMTIRFFGLIGHYFKDVRPWERLMEKDSTTGWQIYNKQWLPDQGTGCRIRSK